MRPDFTKIPCYPLCGELSANSFFQDGKRDYFRCSHCQLVYVPPSQHLAPEDEVAEYRLHQNCPDDFNYRRFLGRLLIPLNRQLVPASEGLDFGCGPGPTLSVRETFRWLANHWRAELHFAANDIILLQKQDSGRG